MKMGQSCSCLLMRCTFLFQICISRHLRSWECSIQVENCIPCQIMVMWIEQEEYQDLPCRFHILLYISGTKYGSTGDVLVSVGRSLAWLISEKLGGVHTSNICIVPACLVVTSRHVQPGVGDFWVRAGRLLSLLYHGICLQIIFSPPVPNLR